MVLFRRLLKRLGLVHVPNPRKYALDDALHPMLESLAGQAQRSPDEMASDLVSEALSRRQMDADLWQRWQSLSPREQQIAALTCLGYTNPQIAAKLGISMATVHTHSGNIQGTFAVNSKSDLRYLLAAWDFSGWDRHCEKQSLVHFDMFEKQGDGLGHGQTEFVKNYFGLLLEFRVDAASISPWSPHWRWQG